MEEQRHRQEEEARRARVTTGGEQEEKTETIKEGTVSPIFQSKVSRWLGFPIFGLLRSIVAQTL